MKRHTEERLLWTVTACCLAIAGITWVWGAGATDTDAAAPDAVLVPIALSLSAEPSSGFASLANGVVERDPFRADRRPAPQPYSQLAEGLPAPSPPPTPLKPALVLRGTIGGPWWEALLEGIPGREGSVLVRQGDTVGGLTLRRISRDTVVVRGLDTTWTLTVKRTWP